MEIKYTYKLIGVRKVASFDGLTDIVISADFIVSGEIAGLPKFDWALGNVPVDTPNATNFKPFDQLTEEEIISWVQNCEPMANVKASLRRSINEQFNNVEYVAWNNELPLMMTQDPIIP
jgi:hypothetical protein